MRHNKYRFLYMIIAGGLISLLYNLFLPAGLGYREYLIGLINSVVITIVIWEGNLRIDSWMNGKYPWINATGKRIIFQGLTAMIYSAGSLILISMLISFLFGKKVEFNTRIELFIASVILGLMVSVILLSFEVSSQFFRNWKTSLTEIERYRSESLQAQLQNLKNQVNPHFLFNNLSVLSSLVYKDQDKAVLFIDQLAKVYRYALDSGNYELISIGEELASVQSYIYLLRIRFDEGLFINLDTQKADMKRILPPMSLQMLLENAIKHNESSAESPLRIDIKVSEERITVSNNFQPRNSEETSSGTGLQNIKERYKFFTDKEVKVEIDQNCFIVELPLLISDERNHS